jgi:uncharacterized membrane protein
MDKLLYLHLFFGPLFLVIAFLFRHYPPKNINALYGYRTGSSMKSQESWDFANQRSGELMFQLALLMLLVEAVTLYFFLPEISLLITSGVLVLGVFWIVVSTEIQLKKRFP